MSCCEKAKSVLQKSKQIVVGYSNLAKGEKYEFTDDRIRACQKCEECTWMSAVEYGEWLLKNGIKILKHFTELEKLPKLPKYKLSTKRRRLYCRICKCYIPAKASVEDSLCPLNKW